MAEQKQIMLLLRSFEIEAIERTNNLISNKWRAELRESVDEFLGSELASDKDAHTLFEHDLLSNLKIRAQQELVCEQELLLIEQAASLAHAMSKMARQSAEIASAKILSKQRQDFVAMLTHDLKNPLIGANRILDLFVSGQLGPLANEQKELLHQLNVSNSESLQLISTLSSIYQYESNPAEIELKECDLIAIVEASFKDLQTWSMNRDIRTNLVVPDLPLPPVWLDHLGIHRLLDNLFSNALKFAAPGGQVQIEVVARPNEVVIEVKDDGEGIPENERKLLFQRFSQSSTGKRYSGGSGLGLYLCKQITQAHGGIIKCLDCQIGTLFQVTLPLLFQPPQLTQATVNETSNDLVVA